MTLLAARVLNYKSFLDSGEIPIGPGFNVVVGQNHAGKTALLEALSVSFVHKPHLSLKTKPTRASTVDPNSEIRLRFAFTREEFSDLLTAFPTIKIPLVNADRDSATRIAREFLASIERGPTVDLVWNPSTSFTTVGLPGVDVRAPADNANANVYIELGFDKERGGFTIPETVYGGMSWASTFPPVVAELIRSRIYFFKAERLNVGEHTVGSDPQLSSDARNLAQVLNLLQTTNRIRWNRYVEYVRAVFPQITQIAVPPIGTTARILVWSFFTPTDSERDDLAVTLADSGTGIGQVLAILYVVLTSDFPRTIIIDEPQSFLHPGAVRKLFEILRRHPQHQYIVSTHSAAAIAAADARSLLLVRTEKGESVVESLDPSETSHLTRALMEIGARLSDLFGADNVLWVEGKTEEVCFPLIMAKANLPISATSVLAVGDTGAFSKRTARGAFVLYNSLSKTSSLIPTALGFIFDREGRSEKERTELTKETSGRVRFTTRRMYENYLLNADAITAVLGSSVSLPTKAVKDWLEKNRWNEAFFLAPISDDKRSDSVWLTEVHGAKLLTSLFSDLTETKVSYDKLTHGKALTQWICDHRWSDFEELASTLEELSAPTKA